MENVTIDIVDTLNIVKQSGNILCRGEHVDPEFTWTGDHWIYTDNVNEESIVETLHKQSSETDAAFWERATDRANVLDRRGNCPTCYR
jgi:hypothetical protein